MTLPHRTIKSALLALPLLTFAPPALAQAEAAPTIAVDMSVTMVSDYRYRGVTASDFNPAIQPDLTVTHESGVYLNLWASNVADNGGADIEADISLGWRREMGRTALDLRALYYVYPGARLDNYAEFSATLEQSIGEASLVFIVSYAPSQKNIGGEDNLYLGLSGEIPVKHTPISLHAGVGYEHGAFSDNKIDWMAGAGLDIGKGYSLDLSYVDTNSPRSLREGKAGAVASFGKSF